MNPLEEAQAVSSLMQECGLTQEQIAQRIGKSRSAVANLLRLLNLPQEVAELVAEGELSEGHARAILGAEDPEMMISLANQAVQRGLNVRQTEALAKAVKEQPAARSSRRRRTNRQSLSRRRKSRAAQS